VIHWLHSGHRNRYQIVLRESVRGVDRVSGRRIVSGDWQISDQSQSPICIIISCCIERSRWEWQCRFLRCKAMAFKERSTECCLQMIAFTSALYRRSRSSRRSQEVSRCSFFCKAEEHKWNWAVYNELCMSMNFSILKHQASRREAISDLVFAGFFAILKA
jgi:hypothetical protein